MTQTGIATDETDRLIASNKIEGTAVYNLEGDRLGSIHNFMVDKRSGHVEYAVLSFGGFLGIGDEHYPLPWAALTYSVEKGGYVVDIDKERLRDAPRYRAETEPSFSPAYGRDVYSYYGLVYAI